MDIEPTHADTKIQLAMARRRLKKRTHLQSAPVKSINVEASTASISRSPKSMVIRVGAGEVGSSVSQLVKDVRSMMEPDTASRLKVKRPESKNWFGLIVNWITPRNGDRTN